MKNIALALAFVLYTLYACACAATVFMPPRTPMPLGTATPAAIGTPTATELIDVYQSWLPYAASIPRATPTRICLPQGCTPTPPRATATRYTGTRPPTETPYP